MVRRQSRLDGPGDSKGCGGKGPPAGGMAQFPTGVSVSRADQIRPLHSAVAGEVCWFSASSTSPSDRAEFACPAAQARPLRRQAQG
jgi:hypothetical protein